MIIEYWYYRIKHKLGQQGAEMVEYVIVLACVAAIGVFFYSQSQLQVGGTRYTKLPGVLGTLWENISNTIDKAQ